MARKKVNISAELQKNLIADRDAGMTVRELAAKYGLSPSTAHRYSSEVQKKMSAEESMLELVDKLTNLISRILDSSSNSLKPDRVELGMKMLSTIEQILFQDDNTGG